MPFKNGVDVVKEMQKYYADHSDRLLPPVYVFLTAFVTPPFKQYAARHGVRECYQKPISVSHLKAIIMGKYTESVEADVTNKQCADDTSLKRIEGSESENFEDIQEVEEMVDDDSELVFEEVC